MVCILAKEVKWFNHTLQSMSSMHNAKCMHSSPFGFSYLLYGVHIHTFMEQAGYFSIIVLLVWTNKPSTTITL